jgi:hypothetical protein
MEIDKLEQMKRKTNKDGDERGCYDRRKEEDISLKN